MTTANKSNMSTRSNNSATRKCVSFVEGRGRESLDTWLVCRKQTRRGQMRLLVHLPTLRYLSVLLLCETLIVEAFADTARPVVSSYYSFEVMFAESNDGIGNQLPSLIFIPHQLVTLINTSYTTYSKIDAFKSTNWGPIWINVHMRIEELQKKLMFLLRLIID